MSKLASKLSKRIMAAALSVAMVMSNMTVYASELTGPQAESSVDESVIETEEPSVTPDDAAMSGVEAVTDEAVDDATDNTVVEPVGDVTDEDGQTPGTGGEEVTVPDAEDGTEDGSLENEGEVKDEEVTDKSAMDSESEDGTYTNTLAVGDGENTVSYTFETQALEAFAKNEKKDTDTVKAGTYISDANDRYFTAHYSKTAAVTTSNQTFEDDYVSVQRLNFGATATVSDTEKKNVVEFTTTTSNAKVKVWWIQGGASARQVGIWDSAGEQAAVSTKGVENGNNNKNIDEFTLQDAGTYYFGNSGNNNYIFKIVVTEEGTSSRSAWNSASSTLSIDSVAYGKNTDNTDDKSKIDVTVSGAVIGYAGADKLTVTMSAKEADETTGELKDVVKATKIISNVNASENVVMTFEPKASADYTFKASLARFDEEETADDTKEFKHTLPLAAPVIKSVVGLTAAAEAPNDATAKISWDAVSEADSYIITVTEKPAAAAAASEIAALADAAEDTGVTDTTDPATGIRTITVPGTETSYTVDKLTINKTYTFALAVKRNGTGGVGDNGTALDEIVSAAETKELKIEVIVPVESTGNTYVFDVEKDIGKAIAAAAGSELSSETRQGTLLNGEGYFTVWGNSGTKTETADVKFEDDYESKLRLSYNGTASTTNPRYIKFTTQQKANVKVWFVPGDNSRYPDLYKDAEYKTKVKEVSGTFNKNAPYIVEFDVEDAGTYYIAATTGNIYYFKVEVTEGGEEVEKTPWGEVAAPVITSAAQNTTDGKNAKDMTVKVTADVSDTGGAKLSVNMYEYNDYKTNGSEGKATSLETQSSAAKKAEHELTFTPTKSGNYVFVATLSREETAADGTKTEVTKVSAYLGEGANSEGVKFTYLLGKPSNLTVTNKGQVTDEENNFVSGKVAFEWDTVKEATSYTVNVKEVTVDKDGKPTNAGKLVLTKEIDMATYVNPDEVKNPDADTGDEAGSDADSDKNKAASTVEEVTSILVYISEKLELDKNYTFGVIATRKGTGDNGADEKSDEVVTPKALKISGKDVATWKKIVYGGNISEKEADMGFSDIALNENEEPSSVRIYARNGKGKVVPLSSQDGVAFYYTKINPNTTNFTLSADIYVNQWTLSNGQEGFGLLAGDSIPENGHEEYWNNSYMAVATKVQYYWNNLKGKLSTVATENTSKVELKLGVESIERTGVTAENWSEFNGADAGAAASKKYFKSVQKTLDTQVHDGTYGNLIGNATNVPAEDTIGTPVTALRMEIELNNTGYFISYTPITMEVDENGKVVKDENGNAKITKVGEKVTNKHYTRDALSKIEKNAAYIGFFAARNADVTFYNISYEAKTPDDTPVEDRPVEEEDLVFSVVSSNSANNADYTFICEANWKGTLTLRDNSGKIIKNAVIEGNPEESKNTQVPIKLIVGANTYQYTFTPDRNYDPYNGEPITRLTNYSAQTGTFTVNYKKYGSEGDALYVAANGKATGDGTKANPLDIYTAVKYVQAGQTIYLMDKVYNLTNVVRINRGIDGEASIDENNKETYKKYIFMIPSPELTEQGIRPVLNFSGASAGIVHAGDYWYFSHFDVTRTADAQKGIQVSGSYNVLDQINTYKNGNTGIQISRRFESDLKPDWPAYNLIRNCTSYLNSDSGYEDADGFAAKLTVGEGNRFVGCVAAYNADDGWDLYAKSETGEIGSVTIDNCITYMNGYVLKEKLGEDSEGKVITGDLAWFGEAEEVVTIDAGNGNGFKMGGSNMKGPHVLRNSIAFYNKAKGIESNSGSDIKIYDSISYNNQSFNIGIYSSATETDYVADGIISYRTEGLKVEVRDSKGVIKKYDPAKTNIVAFEDRIGVWNSNKEATIIKTQPKTYMAQIFNNTNYFWNRTSFVSEDSASFFKNYTSQSKPSDDEDDATTQDTSKSQSYVTDDWFVSLDYDAWFNNYCKSLDSIAVSRNADGSINMHGFLELDTAKVNAAIQNKGVGMGAGEASKPAEEYPKVDETSGDISQGNASNETDSDIDSDIAEQMPGTKDSIGNGLWIAIVDKDEIEYTGKAIKPEIYLYSGTTLLKPGRDYSVTYKNNVNAYLGAYGSDYYKTTASLTKDMSEEDRTALLATYPSNKVPTMIIKGRGNYASLTKRSGEEVTFDINPVNLAADSLNRIGTSDVVITKTTAQKVNPVVTFTTRKLSNTKDYDIEVYYYEDTAAGGGDASAQSLEKKTISDPNKFTGTAGVNYFVDIKGKGNFIRTATVGLYVVDASNKAALASGFKLGKAIPNQYRQGYDTSVYGIETPLPVTLTTTGSDADLVVWNSAKTPLNEVKKDENGKYVYTEPGADNKPVYTGQYTVSYKNNIEIGTASVIVTGVPGAGYYGSKEFKFRIISPTFQQLQKENGVVLINSKVSENASIDSINRTTGKITLATGKTAPDEYMSRTNIPTYDYAGKAIDLVKDYNLGMAINRGTSANPQWYLLTLGKDYKVSYSGNSRAGNATAVFKGIGNYRGSVAQKFKINVFDLNAAANLTPQDGSDVSILGGTFEVSKVKVTEKVEKQVPKKVQDVDADGKPAVDADGNPVYKVDENGEYVYEKDAAGNVITETVLVDATDAYGNVIYKKNADGSFVYETEKNDDGTDKKDDAGNLVYVVKPTMFTSADGNGTYSGYIQTVPYTKGGVRPTVSLKIGDNLLTAGRDYTITYRNNARVSTGVTDTRRMPTIIIRGRNGLKGTLTAYFNISAAALDDTESTITITAQDVGISTRSRTDGYAYEGSFRTRLVVKDSKGKALSAGSDYDKDVKYELVDNTYLTKIKDLDVRTDKIYLKDASDYATIKVTITTSDRSQFYAQGTKVSEYYRVVYARNNIRSARTTVNYEVANTDTSILYTATNNAFYYYEGGITLDEKLLTVELKDNNGQFVPLKWNEDFEVVSYSGNTKRGTAKVVIQGKGKYFGTKVVTFRIVAKDFTWWK